jgi:hypothetical protein
LGVKIKEITEQIVIGKDEKGNPITQARQEKPSGGGWADAIVGAVQRGSRRGFNPNPYLPFQPGSQEKVDQARLAKLQKKVDQKNWLDAQKQKVTSAWNSFKGNNDPQPEEPQDQPQDQQQQQDQEQPRQQQQQQQPRQEQPRPQGNPNQNINTKIDYLKSIGVLQSARITDDERQYIESTDVWVDTNKLEGIDPKTTFFQTRAPHHHMFIRQIVVPARDLGYESNINYQFDLTPAGWWSSMHRAYLNPNSKLGRLVDDWADRN